MGSILFGSDITITNVNMSGSVIPLEEKPIRDSLEPQLVTNGGMVSSYALQSASIVLAQLYTAGQEKLMEFATGTGLEKGFSYIKKLDLIGVERNTIESLKLDLTFYPAEILTQPFGKGTKKYTF